MAFSPGSTRRLKSPAWPASGLGETVLLYDECYIKFGAVRPGSSWPNRTGYNRPRVYVIDDWR